jgi:NAD dependent epimerase/dehydratase family enzyme
MLFVLEHKELSGVYNCSAPNPVTNEILMKTFREKTKTRLALPAPAWLLKIGAVVVKTETELILKSRWVIPEKLLKAGYIFRYSTLNAALENILDHE